MTTILWGEWTKEGSSDALLQFRDLTTQLPWNFAAEQSARIIRSYCTANQQRATMLHSN